MKLKDRAWKYATALVVFLIILNPELIQLALFIDAIGLELLLMLFEVQVVAMFSALFRYRIQPVSGFLVKLKQGSGYFLFAVSPQSIFMQMLVLSAILAAALTGV